MKDQHILASMYLDLLKKTLTDYVHISMDDGTTFHHIANPTFEERLQSRFEGRDWPKRAESMIGLLRLDNIQQCIENCLRDEIKGDFIETGVWRGGACIFARAVLKVNNARGRNVWLADSFQGLPMPKPDIYPKDENDAHHTYEALKVTQDIVKDNFKKYDLLDESVKFIPGWFQDTLPLAPIDNLAVMRLDGDMYESTIVALESLYDKLSVGGYVIIDDYNCVPGCQAAVDDFRSARMIEEPMHAVDWACVYWRKAR